MKKLLNELIRRKIIIISIIAFILLMAIILLIWYFISISPKDKDNEEEIEITIPLGSSSSAIADILEENEIIRSSTAFKIYVRIKNITDFQAGTYYLRQNMTLSEITEMLQTGVMHDPNELKITYIEGKNFRWLAEEISDITNNTEEDVFNVLEDEEYIDSLIEQYWFLTDVIKDENIYYALEGYLFPDTYAIESSDTTVEEIFEKMLDKMEEVLDEYREEIEASDYSVHEILTIASIIEMESVNEDDRKNVSSVIYNRLAANMPIQSDVTTYYAFKIEVGERDLYQEEIDTYNAYNTRGPDMDGKLPIGPISSVSKSSIEAALNPSETDYLFFVADKNGDLYFTTTVEEHNEIISELKEEGLWLEYDE